jgi:hypothetical protein
MDKVLLHNTSPHTRVAIAAVVWAAVPHPPYHRSPSSLQPRLAPSYFTLLDPWRMHSDDGVLQTTACCVKSSASPAKSFTQTSYTDAKVENICAVMETWKYMCCDGDVKNNLNFVKDVSMVYVNFIIIVIGAARKGGIRRHYFQTAPRKIPCVNTSGNIRLT